MVPLRDINWTATKSLIFFPSQGIFTNTCKGWCHIAAHWTNMYGGKIVLFRHLCWRKSITHQWLHLITDRKLISHTLMHSHLCWDFSLGFFCCCFFFQWGFSELRNMFHWGKKKNQTEIGNQTADRFQWEQSPDLVSKKLMVVYAEIRLLKIWLFPLKVLLPTTGIILSNRHNA